MPENPNLAIIKHLYHISWFFRHPQDGSDGIGDLTLHQINILLYVKKHKRVKMGDLASELRVMPATASLVADHLVEAGWLMREHDTTDRRVIYLQVEPSVLEKVSRLHHQKTVTVERLLDQIELADRLELNRILTTLENIIHNA